MMDSKRELNESQKAQAARLLATSHKVAELTQLVHTLSLMNVPVDAAERAGADARYVLARDALQRAQRDYDTALGQTDDATLRAIVGEKAHARWGKGWLDIC